MKKLVIIVSLFLPFCVFAQKNMYIIGEIEGGVLSTDYQHVNSIVNPIVDGENAHFNVKGSLGFMVEWNKLSATAGLSQSLRFWELEGKKNGNTLKVKNTQSFPSIFLGGYYQYPITRNNKLNVYGGSRLGVDFMNFETLNQRKGVEQDYVESLTQETESLSVNIIPEIGIKGYFDSGNFWQLSARYNLPINGNIVEGKIYHYLNGSIAETISYKATGQYIAVAFTYGFKLRK